MAKPGGLPPFAKYAKDGAPGVKENSAITLGEDQGLMTGDGCAGDLSERGEAEVGQAAAFEGGGALDQALGLRIHPKAQAEGPRAAFGGSCDG